jgi:peptidyl-prolyl cis-trans isomerase D
VLPSDVAELLARRDTVWSLAVASVDGSAFAPRIDTSDTTVAAWFETNARRYEIAPRVSVAALRVPAKAFADAVTVTDAEVRAAYDANPARYPAPKPAAEFKLDPVAGEAAEADAAFGTVRPLVEADLRKRNAEKAALKAASDLNVRLFEENVKPADLPAFVASRENIELAEIGAVGTDSIPAELGGNTARAIATEALRLSADRPYSNPVAIPGGAAILVWREAIPARVPALDEIRERVAADYQTAEKRRLFNEAGRALQDSVAASVTAGQSFEAAIVSAAEKAGLKATVKTPEPFSLSGNFPRDLDYNVLTSLDSLSKGKVGDFLPVGENSGRLVYVIDQKIPAMDPASEDYARLRDEFGSEISQASASALLAGIVAAETAKTEPVVE